MAYGHAPAIRSPRGRGVSLLAGFVAAIVAAVIWGFVADMTKHETSIVAIAVGLAVGAAVTWVRGGAGDVALAAGSAVIAIVGCLLGSLAAVIFVLSSGGVAMSQIVGHPAALTDAWRSDINGLSVLFWAFAALAAFRITYGTYGLGLRRRRFGAGAPLAGGYGAPALGQPPAVPGGYGGPAHQADFGGEAQAAAAGPGQPPGGTWPAADSGAAGTG